MQCRAVPVYAVQFRAVQCLCVRQRNTVDMTSTVPIFSTGECSIMCLRQVAYGFQVEQCVCMYGWQLKGANVVKSVCGERLQRSRTQQLQCATVSQHSMYSYIVEPGRERCN